MAVVLKAHGIYKGDRVLVQGEKSMDGVCLYLACLRIGAIYLPLNPAYTPREVDYFIGDARPALLVLAPETIENFKSHNITSLTLDRLTIKAKKSEPHHPITKMKDDDLAAILYTSGTTGKPKGAMLSHRNLASNALTLYDLWHWHQDDILLHALPIFHVHGLFVALHCALLGGSTVWFLPRLDVEALIRLIPKSTVLMGVPTFYTRLLDHDDFTRELSQNIRVFISGSAPLLPETFHQFEAVTGQRILERYGMTEGGMVTSNPYEGPRVAGTVGQALPGVEVRIVDEKGRQVAPGDIGGLEYKGPNLFQGYWEMPEKTAQEMRPDGFFISGDMAMCDAEGRISIVGRAKDLIISGGLNIYPKEIESLLDLLPDVLESAVIGCPHPDLGEAVIAVIVPEDGKSPSEQIILDQLSDQLARFKHPRKIIFQDALPRNTMGKVQKNVLRQNYSDLIG